MMFQVADCSSTVPNSSWRALVQFLVKSVWWFHSNSGFKFDENEAAYTTEKKKFQKTVFGLQDSDDEDVEQEIEETIEQLLDPKRSVKTVSASEAAASGLITGGNIAPGTQVR